MGTEKCLPLWRLQQPPSSVRGRRWEPLFLEPSKRSYRTRRWDDEAFIQPTAKTIWNAGKQLETLELSSLVEEWTIWKGLMLQVGFSNQGQVIYKHQQVCLLDQCSTPSTLHRSRRMGGGGGGGKPERIRQKTWTMSEGVTKTLMAVLPELQSSPEREREREENLPGQSCLQQSTNHFSIFNKLAKLSKTKYGVMCGEFWGEKKSIVIHFGRRL